MVAVVSTIAGDASIDNNQATALLGEMLPPTQLAVQVSVLEPNALVLSWLNAPVDGVAGYRILRSTRGGGPYELVGETSSTTYTDLLLQKEIPYYYVVQAYDDVGVRSGKSAEAFGKIADPAAIEIIDTLTIVEGHDLDVTKRYRIIGPDGELIFRATNSVTFHPQSSIEIVSGASFNVDIVE